jgi:hypothetical protein
MGTERVGAMRASYDRDEKAGRYKRLRLIAMDIILSTVSLLLISN